MCTLSDPKHLIYTFPLATLRGYLEWTTRLYAKRNLFWMEFLNNQGKPGSLRVKQLA